MNLKYIFCFLVIFTSNLFCIYNFQVNDSFYGLNSINDGITDIKDIYFEDYSINLTTLGFPMFSSLVVVQDKLSILDILLEFYRFIGYSKAVNTHVDYLNFFRTLKTIEYFFVEGSDSISFSFSYSSTMNVYYNSMIRDLSGSYSKFYIDTNIQFGFNFYI